MVLYSCGNRKIGKNQLKIMFGTLFNNYFLGAREHVVYQIKRLGINNQYL